MRKFTAILVSRKGNLTPFEVIPRRSAHGVFPEQNAIGITAGFMLLVSLQSIETSFAKNLRPRASVAFTVTVSAERD